MLTKTQSGIKAGLSDDPRSPEREEGASWRGRGKATSSRRWPSQQPRRYASIIEALHRRLAPWFESNRRDLPWRATRNPYTILVSEIMLQQTRVTTVVPYYQRWIKRFPTVQSLARAKTEDVLRQWAGLGYYSRARNLHKAAQAIVEHHDGSVPGDPDVLQKLPGIGRYTAGAVASLAYDRPAPILDGNVIRVLTRLFCITEDTTRTEVRERLWRLAGEILPVRGAGHFNEALMELGALVCLPGAPVCELCPLVGVCRARRTGRAAELPLLRKRKPTRKRTEYALVLRRNGQVLVRQHDARELMAGLWGFPRFTSARKLRRAVMPSSPKRIGSVSHTVMNDRITVHAMAAPFHGVVAIPAPTTNGNQRWIAIRHLHRLALPSADKQLAALVRTNGRKKPNHDPERNPIRRRRHVAVAGPVVASARL